MNPSLHASEADTKSPRATMSPQAQRVRVAYLMSWFPKITETFVLREMIALEQQGFEVEIFPLRRAKGKLIQPDAQPYIERAHFTRMLSSRILWANLISLLQQPFNYLGTLATVTRANSGSPRYLCGALAFFPLAVYFARRMREIGVRHLHAHFASHPAAVAYVIRQIGGIPYSFVAHGSDLHRDQHMLLEKVREASFVVAISDYNRKMILDVCGGEFAQKVHVIHCGVDANRFTARATETPYELGRGPFRMVCVGTLHEVKGQTHLIAACQLLAARGLPFECHFLGAGPDEPALRRQAERAGVSANIHFHGGCTSEEVARQLKLADVLVAPSVPSRDGRREGIPVVLMEAMASGVPCVSSRLSGIPELVEDETTGLLTDPGDDLAIAGALARLAEDAALRRSFGQNSVEKVHREFDLHLNASKLGQQILASVGRDEGAHE